MLSYFPSAFPIGQTEWLARGGPPGKTVLWYEHHPTQAVYNAKGFLKRYFGYLQTDDNEFIKLLLNFKWGDLSISEINTIIPLLHSSNLKYIKEKIKELLNNGVRPYFV
jgi:hypothetical protein